MDAYWVDGRQAIVRRRRPRGLANAGCTCYLNSAMQLLAHCTPFVLYVLQHKPAEPGVIACLRDVFIHVWFRQDDEAVRKFAAAFGEFSKLEVHRQQDAHECMMHILDAADSQMSPGAHRFFFTGKLAAAVQCRRCGHSVPWSDEFTVLMLHPVKGGMEKTLAAHMEPCDLADWKCDRCSCTSCRRQEMKWRHKPAVLLVGLYRFDEAHLGVPVRPDGQLVLGKDTYVLSGVVDHSGSQDSGHYTATCRHVGDLWNTLDDDVVTPVTEADAVQPRRSAYLLAYVRTRA